MSRRSFEALRKATVGGCLAALLTAGSLFGASAGAAGAVVGAPLAASCGAPALASPSRLTLRQMRGAELCLMNRVRAHDGLVPLAFNADLRDSATGHSDSMVDNGYFAHEGPGGGVDIRISRAGYLARTRTWTIGENIAAGRGPAGSPYAIFEDWMHSPPHRANILDPTFRDAGVGVARGNPFGGASAAATYTVDFGSREGLG